jgi:hypothetical protein
MPRSCIRWLAIPICLLAALLAAPTAHAWGDEGHEIVALIADHYLQAPVRARVRTLLASDRTGLTSDTSIGAEATWADRYRDSDRDGARVRYERTQRWHYINLEIGDPGFARACDGYPRLPPGIPASQGPADDCVIDKINEFAAELASPGTAPDERRMALQFVLHLVGDAHQPLHAADAHDEGGNRERVIAPGWPRGSLHGYWDTGLVDALGSDPMRVASLLIGRIRPADLRAWQRGSAADWARQSYEIAARVAYDGLPPLRARGNGYGRRRGRRGLYRLPPAYVSRAEQMVALQLSRAGVRLAMLLNRALGASAE